MQRKLRQIRSSLRRLARSGAGLARAAAPPSPLFYADLARGTIPASHDRFSPSSLAKCRAAYLELSGRPRLPRLSVGRTSVKGWRLSRSHVSSLLKRHQNPSHGRLQMNLRQRRSRCGGHATAVERERSSVTATIRAGLARKPAYVVPICSLLRRKAQKACDLNAFCMR